MYHVINKYDNLSDITIFLPGSVDSNYKKSAATNVINNIGNTNNTYFSYYSQNIYMEFKDFQLDEWSASYGKNKSINDELKLTPSTIRPFGKWYKHHFGDMIVNHYQYGGIFAVHKNHILQHPKEYYENMIKELEVSSNPEVGHYYERAWAAVFGPI